MTSSTLSENFMEHATEFLQALVDWERELPSLSWDDFIVEAQQGKVAVFSVDMINGFCSEGALASPRVDGIIPTVVSTFKGAFALGVRNFVLAQDCHTPESVEFADFPPHCMAGTSEADTVPALAQLPFADLFTVVPKNSLNAFHGTHLGEWLQAHHDLRIAVVVGDCTDLCVYQMAMHLKLYANAHNLPLRVIVPENAVQTYDTPVKTARKLGIMPHDGDVNHLMFLHHMRVNGIEVVREIKG
jgi:nicotinamidase-related amidase